MGIVWILGAGFSKPLGGPLLDKLLSPEAERDLAVRYNNAPLWGAYPDAARLLYQYGRAGEGASVRTPRGEVVEGEDLWEDAEQYLDYLDTAAESAGPGRDRLVQILGRLNPDLQYKDMQGIAAAGRRLLAAECCAFLEGAEPATERWSPYRKWLQNVVGKDDTLITFNYDLVVEKVADRIERPLQYDAGVSSALPLLKLHGSVNWTLQWDADGKSCKVKTDYLNRRAALDCADRELAIAAPGPSKRTLSGGAFSRYWQQALDALKMASAIVFVGYRFPPADAEARERLLDAIRDNGEKYLAIHIVLGPNTGEPDPRRLFALLEHAMAWKRRMVPPGADPRQLKFRTYNIEPQPLWAQDFFSVVDRRSILRPYELIMPGRALDPIAGPG